MPTFEHQFEDAFGTILSQSAVHLSVREIEDAGVVEILQTPGAVLGHWQFLSALLDNSVPTFSFLEPLGHSREVKTAISGLFGRFVARAYATKYLGLTYFLHVRKPPMRLSGLMHGFLARVPGQQGDMPDWVAWGAGVGMAIVEAKGCHDIKSPRASLDRAFAQAERAEIIGPRGPVPFKRYAIATRWGFTSPNVSSPMLWVKDPEVGGDMTEWERDELGVAMLRWHCATLVRPLGFEALAEALVDLARNRFLSRIESRKVAAREALYAVEWLVVKQRLSGPEDALIGSFVTHAGPLASASLTLEQQNTLREIGLRPMFVGIEVGVIKRAIDGHPFRPKDHAVPALRRDGEDGAGTWVIRLEDETTTLTPLSRLT